MLLGLAQLNLRSHLLETVYSGCHQHHGCTILRHGAHVTRIRLSRECRWIGHLRENALLRDAETLRVIR